MSREGRNLIDFAERNDLLSDEEVRKLVLAAGLSGSDRVQN